MTGGPINTGGVKPMSIEGRTKDERERLRGMTSEERTWRKQWLKDQVLAPEEPRFVPELYKELYNPIRRFYQKPLDVLCESLIPKIGYDRASVIRGLVPKVFFLIGGIYFAYYHIKYSSNDWTRRGGWTVYTNRPLSLPGDPDYPRVSDRTKPEDYSDRGFKNRKVFLD